MLSINFLLGTSHPTYHLFVIPRFGSLTADVVRSIVFLQTDTAVVSLDYDTVQYLIAPVSVFLEKVARESHPTLLVVEVVFLFVALFANKQLLRMDKQVRPAPSVRYSVRSNFFVSFSIG